MLTPTPAIVRVHYRDHNDTARTFSAAFAADQHDGCISLVVNDAAWADPGVCRWQMTWDRITHVEVLRPAYTPTVIEQILDAVAMTPGEQVVYDALADIGGPVQYRDVADIVRYHAGHDHLEPYQIAQRFEQLKAKGRVTLEKSGGLDSGIVRITGQYATTTQPA